MKLYWVAGVLLAISGCDSADVRNTNETARIKREMVFFRHDNTGLCFAYWWGGSLGQGGPALATVPCETVKDFLAN